MKVRERAELYASDVYRGDVAKAIDNASRSYNDKEKQLLIDCNKRLWRRGEALQILLPDG